ncbi:probable inactive receptor-like protein kinase At3g56050 [Olea europaea var. sylvestris]|uniref:probable inactive receptor-like protein kinase At3g56050 n=1 Tax=Olea europaea var. sylvestris TaxID=158386 RepID=UPI000C1CEB79|nr:probable inactive receptor-like protein kinase At3g56050 [Olea europaea var. sylvestris]
MKAFWELKSHLLLVLLICFNNLSFCWSLNGEGVALLRFKEKVENDPYGALSDWNQEVGVENPCSWFGIGCSEGHVVVLNLKDLCLRGTLVPDLGNLVHVKSISLRNNSFSGVIPEEISKLSELEVLDLGYNNFSGQLPCHLINNFSIAILLLDNNELLGNPYPEIYELQKLSEVQVNERLLSSGIETLSCNDRLISGNLGQMGDVAQRKLLQDFKLSVQALFFLPPSSSKSGSSPTPEPSPSPSPYPLPPASSPENTSPRSPPTSPPPSPGSVSPSSLPNPAESPSKPAKSSSRNHHRILILSGAIGGPLLLLFLIAGILFCQYSKVATVKPWATGISGQLQRAFVTGVPNLKRSELEIACEDFSNVIGSSSFCTLYKGTLSSGVEIAVASLAIASAKDWSNILEAQFRTKIDTLSKVNHKNFVNLIGYCEEEKPFTRMMVFEYASNGTLFEHLHIKESEHLDWAMRLRIAMGMAYCLEYMHQLTPVVPHRNLTSSAVYLTEDFAAKISDFGFLGYGSSAQIEPNLQSNVYSFGVVLFEMITGKLPYVVGNDSLEDWASDYLRGIPFLREIVDPTLTSFQEDQVEQIGRLIKSCVNPEPRQRPSMRDIAARLRDITSIAPDAAIPRLSPVWWAELEILSTEVN